ncbi:hypothetical protein N5D52_27965 [Pseudomonas sp. GD03860]|uniref:hypothetical protein n=1 Tax=Pseudomonas TaxID=286 RepID=UPI0023645BEB|nr:MULTISPECIES: hypothetical protein [Pseudomonas]MDD2059090.1 hypothetical protein [Pseudomonas putida]MDH0640768.1 hypothetical protein [Pseudomonas sp. GD03860]
MGIKMNLAIDQNGREWDAEDYQRGMGAEPLRCCKCSTAVTFNNPHTREMYDKPVLVPGYFRLLPKGVHEAHCKFGVDEEIKKLAKESDGLIESIQHDKYRMRLVMIKEALEGGAPPRNPEPDGEKAKSGRTYTSSPGQLPAYINSANKALMLRALCESNSDIEQHLELVFEGNIKVAWDEFYFDPPRHMEAFRVISHNTIQHPIALEGRIRSVRTALKNDPSKNVLNLQMNKYRGAPQEPSNGIGLEVSIWSPKSEWFKGLQQDDDVVILGVWKATTNATEPAPMKDGYFKTLTKRRLSLTLVLKAQITKIDTKPS